MNHKQISIQPARIIQTKMLVTGRQFLKEVLTHELVKSSEFGILKGVLQLQWLCPEVSPGVVIRDPSKQHNCLQEQYKGIGVGRRMTNEHILRCQVLGIAWHIRLRLCEIVSKSHRIEGLTFSSKSISRKGNSVPMSRSSTPCSHPPTDTMRSNMIVIHHVLRLDSNSFESFGGAR